ncbi:MAG: phosphate signaling complex protein PhoU [Lachnospiraceae bacterium]|nr:phosphate signaling complex protein PhoU [Lachnospiraceae bacterium]
MRTRFDEQLESLNVELITMGSLCEEGIMGAVEAMDKDDEKVRNRVKEIEKQIDAKEKDVENLCMKLLLQQQPVAKDLRTISSALKMISDMERIGDQALDIVEITRYIGNSDVKSKIHIKEMALATVKMVTESIDSFVKKDLDIAYKVMEDDDIVDELFDEIKDEIISILRNNSYESEYYVDLLMIAKYLERIGDHAVNIAEWVEYSITGMHKKGNTDDLLS